MPDVSIYVAKMQNLTFKVPSNGQRWKTVNHHVFTVNLEMKNIAADFNHCHAVFLMKKKSYLHFLSFFHAEEAQRVKIISH